MPRPKKAASPNASAPGGAGDAAPGTPPPRPKVARAKKKAAHPAPKAAPELPLDSPPVSEAPAPVKSPAPPAPVADDFPKPSAPTPSPAPPARDRDRDRERERPRDLAPDSAPAKPTPTSPHPFPRLPHPLHLKDPRRLHPRDRIPDRTLVPSTGPIIARTNARSPDLNPVRTAARTTGRTIDPMRALTFDPAHPRRVRRPTKDPATDLTAVLNIPASGFRRRRR
jgi:hypothetical protein